MKDRFLPWMTFVLIVATAPLSGCITTSGDRLSDISPVAGSSRPAIEQTVGDFSFHLDGGKMVTSNKMGRVLNNEILGRWVESGFIASHRYVKSSNFSAPSVYRLTLSGHQEGDSSIFLQIISGLSLTAIPYYVDSKMDLEYSLENSQSGCIFDAKAKDSYNTVIGLLLLPFSPFAQGGEERTFDRLANHLYAKLSERGAFEEHRSCREPAAVDSEYETKRKAILDDR